MMDFNALQLEYLSHIADEMDDDKLSRHLKEAGEHLDYEVDEHLIGLVPEKFDDRVRVILYTAKVMTNTWKESSNMSELNWDLYCAMHNAIEMVIYFSNCTTHHEDEPIEYDLRELERRLEKMLTMVRHTKERMIQQQKED